MFYSSLDFCATIFILHAPEIFNIVKKRTISVTKLGL